MPTLRNNSLVPIIAPQISAKALGYAHGMTFPMSLRGLLDKRDKNPWRVRRIGICFCTPINTPVGVRHAKMNNWWFDRLFVDIDGVAAYFREMSGGRHYIEWEFFERRLLTSQEKDQADKQGKAAAVIAALRPKAKAAGIPVDNFDRFIWVIDDLTSHSGVTRGDSLVASLELTPFLVEHELTHALGGVCAHADQTSYDDYNDPFCVMGKEGVARTFVNGRLSAPNPNGYSTEHGNSAPGLCAPSLYAAGWLDYEQNVDNIPLSVLHPPQEAVDLFGASSFPGSWLSSISVNQGAPPLGSQQKIALALGDHPSGIADDPAQYWIEYRHPSRFDRHINIFTSGKQPSPDGVVVLHEVSYEVTRRCRRVHLHSYVRDWVGARPNVLLNVPALGVTVRILNVNAPQGVTLAVEPLV